MPRKYNLLFDRPDARDADPKLSVTSVTSASLPATYSVDKTLVGPVVDQGETGSCAGQAGAALICWHERLLLPNAGPYSARFIWTTAKEMDPWVPSVMFDSEGTRLRDVLKALRKVGAPAEELWPFSEPAPKMENEEFILQNASNHRIGRYWRLARTKDMRAHLVHVGPFLMGVTVFEGWEEVGSDGLINVQTYAREELGGHAVLCTGYDESGFWFKNSWGTDWGRDGYGHVSFKYAVNYVMDCWGADR